MLIRRKRPEVMSQRSPCKPVTSGLKPHIFHVPETRNPCGTPKYYITGRVCFLGSMDDCYVNSDRMTDVEERRAKEFKRKGTHREAIAVELERNRRIYNVLTADFLAAENEDAHKMLHIYSCRADYLNTSWEAS